MRYMMLIYQDPALPPNPAAYEEYGKFTQEVAQNGLLRGGDPLEGTETATTVRVRNGGVATTDGPFAETKEVLGGYYILDCKDLDEALSYAAKIPGAKTGAIEVRPIMELPGQ